MSNAGTMSANSGHRRPGSASCPREIKPTDHRQRNDRPGKVPRLRTEIEPEGGMIKGRVSQAHGDLRQTPDASRVLPEVSLPAVLAISATTPLLRYDYRSAHIVL